MTTRKLICTCLSFMSYPFIAIAMASSPDAKPALETNTLESSFSVLSGNIKVNKADLKTCKTDNAYLISALAEKNIKLKGYDYKVNVGKKSILNNPLAMVII